MLIEYESLECWLDRAVSGIRFKPDRLAVRAELYAHLEDRTLDLLRIFPDMDPDEARDRALSTMGDAEELKKKLGKIHRPWLGWLWTASRIALGILAALALVAACIPDESSKNLLVGGWWPYRQETFGTPERPEPARVELEGYTFQIIDAAYLESETWGDSIQVIFRVSSPRFWERIAPGAVYRALTVTAPNGEAFPMDCSVDWPGDMVRVSVSPARWGIVYRDFYVDLDTQYVGDWAPGDRVTLDFNFEAGSFVLSAGVAERVVME